jgi:ABC-type transport system involved in multi-copper enzyme maturation permease subunit
MQTIVNIAKLTIRETQRRRILWVALFMGIAFLVVFGLGFHYIMVEFEAEMTSAPGDESRFVGTFLTLAGLYAINFLVIVMAALLSAGIISGEVESHTIETLVTKPVRRWEVVVGKWLGLAVIIAIYLLALAGGVLLIAYLRIGFTLANVGAGLSLMLLGGLSMLSLTILGGTRLSTLANGSLVFMLYAVAFIGGWIEQLGAMLRNETAVDLGIASSLLMPAEVLWKRASLLLQPEMQSGLEFVAGPLTVFSQPSPAMTLYAVAYTLLLLGAALWSFSRRDL